MNCFAFAWVCFGFASTYYGLVILFCVQMRLSADGLYHDAVVTLRCARTKNGGELIKLCKQSVLQPPAAYPTQYGHDNASSLPITMRFDL